MDYLTFVHPGTREKMQIPAIWLKLNDKQQVCIIGIDFNEIEEHKGLKYDRIGRLSEQNFIFKQQLTNSLVLQDWNFEEYPDPEVILITVTDDYPETQHPPIEDIL